MAQALGANVTLVTGVHPGYDRSVFSGIHVLEIPAATAPRYANSYDSDGNRTQLLLETGTSMDAFGWDTLPRCDVLLIAPAFHEFTERPPVPSTVTAVSLQGALRSRGRGNRVVRRTHPYDATKGFVTDGSYLFLSDEDTRYPAALARRLSLAGGKVFLTRGHRGAAFFSAGKELRYPAITARHPVDPTGAGDCFATAFAVRVAETGDEAEAIRFALAAGSLAVEAPGLEGIPTREAIESRLQKEAA